MSTSLTSNDFLTDLLIYFQTQCINGMNNLLPEALFLVSILGIILLCTRIITKGQIFGGGSWHDYIMTVLKVGAFVFLVNHWEELLIQIIFKSFEMAGQTASNHFEEVHPSAIFMTGFKLTKEVLANIMMPTFSLGSLLLLGLKLVMVLAIIGMFAYMAIMFFMVTVEFYVFSSMSIILVPFGMISYFKFMFDNVVSAMFGFGVKYMVMIFILGLGATLFSSWNTALSANIQPQDLIKAAVGIAVYCIMCLKIPDLISGMINGSPSSDSGTQMAASAVSAVAGGAGRKALSAGKFAGGKAWNATQGARQKGWAAAKQGGKTVMNEAQKRSLEALRNIGKKF